MIYFIQDETDGQRRCRRGAFEVENSWVEILYWLPSSSPYPPVITLTTRQERPPSPSQKTLMSKFQRAKQCEGRSQREFLLQSIPVNTGLQIHFPKVRNAIFLSQAVPGCTRSGLVWSGWPDWPAVSFSFTKHKTDGDRAAKQEKLPISSFGMSEYQCFGMPVLHKHQCKRCLRKIWKSFPLRHLLYWYSFIGYFVPLPPFDSLH